MKNFKTMLHILITCASLFGFLGGWATLAHSRKPTTGQSQTQPQTQEIDPLPPLDPIPAMNSATAASSNTGGLLSIFNPPAANSSPSSIVPLSQAPTRRTRTRILTTNGS